MLSIAIGLLRCGLALGLFGLGFLSQPEPSGVSAFQVFGPTPLWSHFQLQNDPYWSKIQRNLAEIWTKMWIPLLCIVEYPSDIIQRKTINDWIICLSFYDQVRFHAKCHFSTTNTGQKPEPKPGQNAFKARKTEQTENGRTVSVIILFAT